MECKKCNHEILKRKQKQGIVYVHKAGGKYCKKTIYGKGLPFGKVCYCSNAELKLKQDS